MGRKRCIKRQLAFLEVADSVFVHNALGNTFRDHARLGMPYELAAMHAILGQVRGIARAHVLDVDLYDRGTIYRDFQNEGISL